MNEKTIAGMIVGHGQRLEKLEEYFFKRALSADERDCILDWVKGELLRNLGGTDENKKIFFENVSNEPLGAIMPAVWRLKFDLPRARIKQLKSIYEKMI